MNEPFERIKPEEIKNFIGRPVHLGWANPACVWRLENVFNNGTATVRTRKTKKLLVVKHSDLFKIRDRKDYG